MTETIYNKNYVSEDTGVYIHSNINTATNFNSEFYEHWFCAETSYGNVYIGIKQRKMDKDEQKIPKLLQMVIALYDVEEYIQIMEDWLDCGLNTKPVSIMPSSINKLTIDIENKTTNRALKEITIGWQDETLDKLPNKNITQINNTIIKVEQIKVEVILSELSINQNQQDKIQKGSIFLMPESYEENWNIKIISKINRKLCNIAVLKKDLRTICDNIKSHIDGQKAENENQAITYDKEDKSYLINISTISIIPLDYMLGWRDEEKCVLSSTLRKNDIEIYCDKHIFAKGKLIRVANGYGVYIETLM